MQQCVSCKSELTDGAKFCPDCGKPTSITEMETAVAPAYSSTSATTDGRFAPGTMLVDRYRIVGRLDKGGMGLFDRELLEE